MLTELMGCAILAAFLLALASFKQFQRRNKAALVIGDLCSVTMELTCR